ncbi:MAG: hypothetical protein ABR548_05520 [Actinomycetota bacterium]|nr:hypothetical protein [Actinomycetota bacterium]
MDTELGFELEDERLQFGRFLSGLARRDPAFRASLQRGEDGTHRVIVSLLQDSMARVEAQIEQLGVPASIAYRHVATIDGEKHVTVRLLDVVYADSVHQHSADECGVHPRTTLEMFLLWLNERGGHSCLHVTEPAENVEYCVQARV